MNADKITPAPWGTDPCSDDCILSIVGPGDAHVCLIERESCGNDIALENAEFIILARNAFDVMARRKWHAYFDESVDGWFMGGHHGRLNGFSQSRGSCFSDPFTALVEADKWYRENVDGK